MISGIEISGIGIELEDEVKAYIDQKIGRLDRFIPRLARKSIHAQVKLRESSPKGGTRYTCEVIINLPDEQITMEESTLNLIAAIDIVEAKLKNRLKKYKDAYIKEKRGRRHAWLRSLNVFNRGNNMPK